MTDGFRLVMTKGPDPGQTFTLSREVMNVGRDPNNDITINDPQVSRLHARMTIKQDSVVLEDLGSTNGTFVNGMRLSTSHALYNGDVIGLGDVVTLTFYGQTVGVEETMVGMPNMPAQPMTEIPIPTPPVPDAQPLDEVSDLAEEKPRRTGLWIALGCAGLLIVGCFAVAALLWFAPESFWQQLIDMGIPVDQILDWMPF